MGDDPQFPLRDVLRQFPHSLLAWVGAVYAGAGLTIGVASEAFDYMSGFTGPVITMFGISGLCFVLAGFLRYRMLRAEAQEEGDEKEPQKMTGWRRVRSVLLPIVLSLILSGTGQIYNRQYEKGLSMALLALLMWFVLLGWLVKIWSVVDAAVVGRRRVVAGDVDVAQGLEGAPVEGYAPPQADR